MEQRTIYFLSGRNHYTDDAEILVDFGYFTSQKEAREACDEHNTEIYNREPEVQKAMTLQKWLDDCYEEEITSYETSTGWIMTIWTVEEVEPY